MEFASVFIYFLGTACASVIAVRRSLISLSLFSRRFTYAKLKKSSQTLVYNFYTATVAAAFSKSKTSHITNEQLTRETSNKC